MALSGYSKKGRKSRRTKRLAKRRGFGAYSRRALADLVGALLPYAAIGAVGYFIYRSRKRAALTPPSNPYNITSSTGI